MTKKEKLLERFLNVPKDFTYQELKTLLTGLGFEEHHLGKTSGSRVQFINKEFNLEFKIHKPHPGNILKIYLVKFIIEQLKSIQS